MKGFIYLHRKILENPIVCKDADHIAVWIYLLLNATHKNKSVIFNGKKTTLRPGQLITGRKSISEKIKISESKVQRVLKSFEIEQQIEQQTGSKNRIITVLNWSLYQNSEHQNEQQVNSKRTTTEQQVNTNNNVNNDNNEKNEKKEDIEEVINHFRRIAALPNPRLITPKRINAIQARIKEYGLGVVKETLDKVNSSSFLQGDNERGWRADMDWIFKAENFIKILEGKYDEKNHKPAASINQENKSHQFGTKRNLDEFIE